MELDPISQAVVTMINASGVVPFHRFDPVQARAELLKLFLINDDIEWMLDHYFVDRSQGNDWRASPILAPSFAGLPPALVVTASHDPLVDEGKLYADRLREAGVPVEYACFDGTIHGFVSMAAIIPSGARAMALICQRIREATGVAGSPSGR